MAAVETATDDGTLAAFPSGDECISFPRGFGTTSNITYLNDLSHIAGSERVNSEDQSTP